MLIRAASLIAFLFPNTMPVVNSLAARAKAALHHSADKPRSRAETVRIFKAFRKIEEARLRILHGNEVGGRETCELRSQLTDYLLKYLWADALVLSEVPSPSKFSISVVAVGGYARSCMNPFSDVDMTFIVPGNGVHPIPEQGKIITTFVNLIWDLKMPLGDHATRSVGETFKQANVNYEIKTSLIGARHIAGQSEAFNDMVKGFDKQCIDGQEVNFLKDRQQDIANRHEKFENTPYRQEPNVKNGLGGLREYHNLQWITYAKFRTTNLKELVKRGLLLPNSLREIERGYDFILRVRTELHYIEKRESDVLTLRLQGVVANHFNYKHHTILRRIEVFMREYYMHAVALLHRTSEVLDRFHLLTLEEEMQGVKGYLARLRGNKTEKFDGFTSKNERLYADNDEIFREDPPRLMRLFIHTQQRHLRMSPDLFHLVQKNFALVNHTFRYSKAARETFEAILSQKGDVSRVLRQMHRVGFLGKWMPEFGALTCLVQHEFFHQYTADEHTLRCIDRLDELAGAPKQGYEFYQKLFREMQEPAMLYLALILHDAGRAANKAEHSSESTDLASKVCRRMQITGERRRLLLFLVDSHLELYRVATKFNIEDPGVIEAFARIVRNKQNLDTLLVMTVADSKGTSANSWNSWKESLILQLYRNTVSYLNDPSDFVASISAPLDELTLAVQKKFDATYAGDIAAHFKHMPRSYFNFRTADTLAFHIRSVRAHQDQSTKKGDRSDIPTLIWEDHPEQGCSELIVVCKDRPLLLARISGALAASNINILGADLFQRSDGIVFDIFRVCTTNFAPVSNDRTRNKVKAGMEEAFQTDAFDFSAAIGEHRRPVRGLQEIAEIPQRVHINNARSPEHTVIELQAADRIGLLYDIFTTISRLGLDISHARINTEKGAALDNIYIQTSTGEKLTDKDTMATLREGLEKAVFVV